MSKTIVITGASDGIGAAAARTLKANGHNVVVVGRSSEKTQAVASDINAPFYLCDFSDLDDVAALAVSLSEDLPRIDVLINNAGGVFGERKVTKNGFESTFQVNHLAPLLLTTLLLDTLTRSKATVVATSSVAHSVFAKFNIDDAQLEVGYSPRRAYGNSKLANILMTRQLDDRYDSLYAAAYHPGIIATNFASDSTSAFRILYQTAISKLLTTPAQGADTMIWLAETIPGKHWQSGGYFVKRKLKQPSRHARDDELGRALWDYSMKALGPWMPHRD